MDLPDIRHVAESRGAWLPALYESMASSLVLYGRSLGLSHAEGEDVLQETFVALTALAQRPRDPRAYCLRAFRNRAMNYRRSLWRRVRREWEARAWFEPGGEPEGRLKDVTAWLEALPTEQREVVVLKIWHGCTFDAIGELLEISPNTAAGRYRYGLAKMRRWMEAADNQQENTGHERFRTTTKALPATPCF